MNVCDRCGHIGASDCTCPPKPPPGSNAALDAGCRCPVLDNAHGRGWMGGVQDESGNTIYVYSAGCPVHFAEAPDAER